MKYKLVNSWYFYLEDENGNSCDIRQGMKVSIQNITGKLYVVSDKGSTLMHGMGSYKQERCLFCHSDNILEDLEGYQGDIELL